MADWATISALATAGGTLVLAIATFASVRSANRSARAAERALLAGLRPLLVASRPQDAPQKVGFADARVLVVDGGCGALEATADAVYLAISLRNVGSGIAVLHGWTHRDDPALADMATMGAVTHAELSAFRRLTRDLYVAPGEVGFWQGAFREPATAEFVRISEAVARRDRVIIEILYGDQEGGQRRITRFSLLPWQEGRWAASVSRHWNLDGPDPR